MRLSENSTHPLDLIDDHTLSGLFAETETYSANHRLYPDDIYIEAYNDLQPRILAHRALGELDHPLDYDEVRLGNVSHAITETHTKRSGNKTQVYGTVKLLDTPAGLIAQCLAKAGIPVGISSRAVGNTKSTSEGEIVTSMELITYDLVADPAFNSAVLSPTKSRELAEGLHHIESHLPLNESVTTSHTRELIQSLRESLNIKETSIDNEVDINKAEITALRLSLASARQTITEDTDLLKSSRSRCKLLEQKLSSTKSEYKVITNNMSKLQESYNHISDTTVPMSELEDVKSQLLETQKQLAVERRGMSYNTVSKILEGATLDDIEDRLDSLHSMRRSLTPSSVDIKGALTESTEVSSDGRFSKLASIVSKV